LERDHSMSDMTGAHFLNERGRELKAAGDIAGAEAAYRAAFGGPEQFHRYLATHRRSLNRSI